MKKVFPRSSYYFLLVFVLLLEHHYYSLERVALSASLSKQNWKHETIFLLLGTKLCSTITQPQTDASKEKEKHKKTCYELKKEA